MPKVVIAPDKFKFSLSAKDVAISIAKGIPHKLTKELIPLSDGGDGMLESLVKRPNMSSLVTDAFGNLVQASWHFSDGEAIIESAKICGLEVSSKQLGSFDPVNATTKGLGELINKVIEMGAHKLTIGIGGTATTDGGYGMISALNPRYRNKSIDVVALCDVKTKFLDAAVMFGPQKGASPKQVELLTRRLEFLVQKYEEEYKVNVNLPRSGAGGGLAGGLLAFFGAELVDGAPYIGQMKNLEQALADADLVITGEGKLDDSSFSGKVVGYVLETASHLGLNCAIIAGQVDSESELNGYKNNVFSLADYFGLEAALSNTKGCLVELGRMIAQVFF